MDRMKTRSVVIAALGLSSGALVRGFTSTLPTLAKEYRHHSRDTTFTPDNINDKTRQSTALHVWWFGGTPNESEISSSGEECELVAVRIDRTSANSRRIGGEIVVNASLLDVWSILTDYDRLSTHVPNLVASKRVSGGSGEPGDGSYECRLYQRGAQRIIGFEFGADVTMVSPSTFR